jgi:1-acyl-sn-glycerol-3-phosphate acyltransferase
MLKFRSLIFNIIFYAFTILGLTLLFPLFLLPQPFYSWIPRAWTLFVSFVLRLIIGTSYSVTGRQNIPKTPVIFATKHQSSWETMAFNHLLDYPVFFLKKDLLWIPLFGFYLHRVGMIALERGGTSALKTMIKKGRERIEEGRSLIIFPEGTRSAPGTHNDYKRGVFLLYKNLHVPVVPVALNSGVFWPRRTFLKYPGIIRVSFLKPLPPGLDQDEFMKKLQSVIEKESLKLYQTK